MALSFKAIIGLILIAVALGAGVFATYFNIKNARGPREFIFVLKVSLWSWAIILSMLVVAYVLPPPYRYAALLVYFVVCPILIYRWSTTHQLIRVMERRESKASKPPEKPPA